MALDQRDPKPMEHLTNRAQDQQGARSTGNRIHLLVFFMSLTYLEALDQWSVRQTVARKGVFWVSYILSPFCWLAP